MIKHELTPGVTSILNKGEYGNVLSLILQDEGCSEPLPAEIYPDVKKEFKAAKDVKLLDIISDEDARVTIVDVATKARNEHDAVEIAAVPLLSAIPEHAAHFVDSFYATRNQIAQTEGAFPITDLSLIVEPADVVWNGLQAKLAA